MTSRTAIKSAEAAEMTGGRRDMDDVLFGDAQERALHYLSTAETRRVFPDAAALAGLAAFDEALPDRPVDALSTIRLLDRAGSPATVATTGGRYFGFVTGGSLPVATGGRLAGDDLGPDRDDAGQFADRGQAGGRRRPLGARDAGAACRSGDCVRQRRHGRQSGRARRGTHAHSQPRRL
jgi:hypothetical protein